MTPWEHFMLRSLFWGEMVNGFLMLTGFVVYLRHLLKVRKAHPVSTPWSATCSRCGLGHTGETPEQAQINAEQCDHLVRNGPNGPQPLSYFTSPSSAPSVRCL